MKKNTGKVDSNTIIIVVTIIVAALIIGGSLESFNATAAAVTAGGFIYIAAADLVPELHEKHSAKDSLAQLLALILGIGAMFALVLLES